MSYHCKTSSRKRTRMCAFAGVQHVRTVIVAVQVVEHETQPFLMSPQVLGELLEIQQAIVVDVAFEDYL